MKQKNIRLAALAFLCGALLTGLAPRARASDRELRVNLDVSAIGSSSGTFAVGQKHTWILRGSIPNGLARAKSYVLSHRIDERLTLESGSILVILHTADGRQRSLRIRDHYQLEEGQRGDRIRVSLTPAGMAYAGSNLGTGPFSPELRVSFQVSINRNAQMGTAIPGRANISYTDPAGVRSEAASDQPEVHTGGLRLHLTDGNGLPLAGGRFRLARLATGMELSDSRIPKGEILLDGKAVSVVYPSFFSDQDMAGEPVREMMTDENGFCLAWGLPYGRYYLVQTGTPWGSEALPGPVPVTVNEVSHLTKADGWKDMEGNTVDSTVQIVNTPVPQSRGEAFLTAATLMTAAGLSWFRRRF